MAEPVVLTGNAYEFQRDLGRYWRHVRRSAGINVTAQGWIYKNAFKGLLAALNVAGEAPTDENLNGRFWFMRRLLTVSGDLDSKFAAAVMTSPTMQMLDKALPERIRYCFDAWRDLAIWNEVYRVSAGMEYDPRAVQNPPELARARQIFLRTLAKLQSTRLSDWVPFERLVDDLKRNNYDWLFPRNFKGRKLKGGTVYYQTPYYYNNNPYSITFTNVKSESQGWDVIERSVMALMLSGPLGWMGIVDVTYTAAHPDERAAPTAVKLTPVGSWLLGLTAQPEFPETGGRLVVQPNFTVIAIEPIADAILVQLDGFADVTGGDRAINYVITRQSVYRAQREGKSIASIVALLETHSGLPLPANVRRTLEEWDEQHGRITFHRKAHLVQFADDAALQGARGALGHDNVHVIAPGFARVSRDVADPIGALDDAGWSPLVTHGQKSDAAGSLALDESGRITFLNSVPSIYSVGAVAPFAEGSPVPNHITANSVRTAMTQGHKLEKMLDALERASGASLPKKLETNLRTWAGFYGQATMQPVILLELSSAEVLANLVEARELRGYVTAIPGSATPLAVVNAEHADEVRSALAERGVVIIDK